jgi:putative ABC transport system permease protein
MVLVVLAIAIGIAAFATVMSSYAILTRELDKGYLGTNPASFTIATDAIDDVLLAKLEKLPGIAAIEPRRIVSGRIKAGPAQWRNLMLFVVRDYSNIRISRLAPQKGAWPPGRGEMLIERDAMRVARAAIGDQVTIRLGQNDSHKLNLTGSVKDVGQAQARMENIVYGYITLDTLADLGEQTFLDRLNVLVTGNIFDEEHIRRIADEARSIVEGAGHRVRRVDIPTPGKHPHSELMGLLLLSMSAFGLFALLLSSILVVNLVSALMARQVRQIGIMRAIGASRLQVGGIYLSQSLLLGWVAFLIALPVGVLGGRLLSQYLAVFLNFDITSFFVPVWVFLLVVIVGCLIPLLASAIPIWSGTGRSVHQSLTDFGVSSSGFGEGAFDRFIGRIGGLKRPMLLAVRNSFRRRFRLVLTVITLAAGGVFFISALNVRASLINSIDRLFDTRKFDLSVAIAGLQPLEKVERALTPIAGIAIVEGWIATQATIVNSSEAVRGQGTHGAGAALHTNSPTSDSFTVLGLSPNTRLFSPTVTSGRMLDESADDQILVNSRLASRGAGVKVGDKLNLRMGPAERAWSVVGISDEPFSPAAAYVNRKYFDQAGGHAGLTNSIRIRLRNTSDEAANQAKDELEHNLDSEGIQVIGSQTKPESRFSIDQHMVMIYVFLIVVSAILAGVGGLGLMTTMSINVLDRRREMGVLRAIGATPRAVWMIVVGEALMIGLLSWVLAGLVAWPVGRAVGDFLVRMAFKNGLDFKFEIRGLLIWLVVTVILCVLASLFPAWNASRRPVHEAVGYE